LRLKFESFVIYPEIWCHQHSFPSLPILDNNEQESFLNVDLNATPFCELLYYVWQSLHFGWGLSKDLDVIDEKYDVKLIAVVGVLTTFFLVLGNLRSMADTMILLSRCEHPQP